jgi:hypothetical protein
MDVTFFPLFPLHSCAVLASLGLAGGHTFSYCHLEAHFFLAYA